MDIFLQKCIDSLQDAFINPLELSVALFYDGWMQFIGLLDITHSLLMSLQLYSFERRKSYTVHLGWLKGGEGGHGKI